MKRKAIYLFISVTILSAFFLENSWSRHKAEKELKPHAHEGKATENSEVYSKLMELQLSKKFHNKQRKMEAHELEEKHIKEEERQALLAKTDDNARARIFEYMSNEYNRRSVMKAALKLNDGEANNACVYFASEVLRRVNISIPVSTSNCTELTTILKNRGWAIYLDYKSLQKGDICFTTDAYGGKGAPTHAYIFMDWVEQGKYDYAYIVDNQEPKYGNIYHVRNIAKVDYFGGEVKEAFRYFMRR